MTTKVYRVIRFIPYEENYPVLHTHDFDSAYRFAKRLVRMENRSWGNGRSKRYLQGLYFFDHNYYQEYNECAWITGFNHEIRIDSIEVYN